MAVADYAMELTLAAGQAAAAKFGTDIAAFAVAQHFPLADVFLVVSAANERQVEAIVDEVEKALYLRGVKVRHREGGDTNRWVLLDFGDIIVHVQHREEREHYALDRLWRDCPRLELPDFDQLAADRAGADCASESGGCSPQDEVIAALAASTQAGLLAEGLDSADCIDER